MLVLICILCVVLAFQFIAYTPKPDEGQIQAIAIGDGFESPTVTSDVGWVTGFQNCKINNGAWAAFVKGKRPKTNPQQPDKIYTGCVCMGMFGVNAAIKKVVNITPTH
ncbi:MAG TPA: hypothetical protein VEA59_06370 [Patescibacteria group bacterium]|nr:hypothetical protein [Patescibacteria group bacterium]